MKVKDDQLVKWKELFTHGDVEKIRLAMPKKVRPTNETIRVCARNGEFSNVVVYKYVSNFYKMKEKMIESLQ